MLLTGPSTPYVSPATIAVQLEMCDNYETEAHKPPGMQPF